MTGPSYSEAAKEADRRLRDPAGLKLDLSNAPFITARPTAEMSASDAVLSLLTGPLATFANKIDAELAAQSRRIKQLEGQLAALERRVAKQKKARTDPVGVLSFGGSD